MKTSNVRLFEAKEEITYRQRVLKDKKRKRIEKQLKDCKEEIAELDEELRKVYRGTKRLRMANGIVVERKLTPIAAWVCTKEMVGDVLRGAYKRLTYNEIED